MKTAFNTLVRPAVLELERLTGTHIIEVDPGNSEEEYNIPVRVQFRGGTTQVFEDGFRIDCDHAGADEGSVDLGSLFYDPRTGQVEEIEDIHQGFVCDQCPAWSDETGEWHV